MGFIGFRWFSSLIPLVSAASLVAGSLSTFVLGVYFAWQGRKRGEEIK